MKTDVISISNQQSSAASEPLPMPNYTQRRESESGSYLECRGKCDGKFMSLYAHPLISNSSETALLAFVKEIAGSVRAETFWQREDMAQELAALILLRSKDVELLADGSANPESSPHCVCGCLDKEGVRAYFIGTAIRMRQFGALECTKSLSAFESRRVSLDDEESPIDDIEDTSVTNLMSHEDEDDSLTLRFIEKIESGDNDEIADRIEAFFSHLSSGAREQFIAKLKGCTNEQTALRKGVQWDSVRKSDDRLSGDIEKYLKNLLH